MNTDIIYFHGHKKGAPLKQPSLIRPFYITDDFDFAKNYSSFMDPVVYVLTLKPTAKLFNFCMGEDISKLKGKTFYTDYTLDMMAKLYTIDNPEFTFWASTHSGMHIATAVIEEGINQIYDDYFHIGFLKNDIHHNRLNSISYIGQEEKDTAKTLQEEIYEKTGIKTISEYMNSGNVMRKAFKDVEDDDDMTFLQVFQVNVAANVLDALADNTYPFDFLSYRRPLYKAIIEMGYNVIQDNDTDFSENKEFCILDESAVDKVLNFPLYDGYDIYVAPMLNKISQELVGKSKVSVTKFMNLLKECKTKSRKMNFKP